jgi:hypothetical protein
MKQSRHFFSGMVIALSILCSSQVNALTISNELSGRVTGIEFSNQEMEDFFIAHGLPMGSGNNVSLSYTYVKDEAGFWLMDESFGYRLDIFDSSDNAILSYSFGHFYPDELMNEDLINIDDSLQHMMAPRQHSLTTSMLTKRQVPCFQLGSPVAAPHPTTIGFIISERVNRSYTYSIYLAERGILLFPISGMIISIMMVAGVI